MGKEELKLCNNGLIKEARNETQELVYKILLVYKPSALGVNGVWIVESKVDESALMLPWHMEI